MTGTYNCFRKDLSGLLKVYLELITARVNKICIYSKISNSSNHYLTHLGLPLLKSGNSDGQVRHFATKTSRR